jgi:hypothetical protein
MRFFAPSASLSREHPLSLSRHRSVRDALPKQRIHPHRSAGPQEPRALPARSVPSSPFHTTSTVCSALDRPGFPRVTLMGFRPSGSLPVSGVPARHRADHPLLPFRHHRFGAGFASDTCARRPSTSGSLSEVRPSPLNLGFPKLRVRSPRGLSCETDRPNLPKETWPVGLVTNSDCERAAARWREGTGETHGDQAPDRPLMHATRKDIGNRSGIRRAFL